MKSKFTELELIKKHQQNLFLMNKQIQKGLYSEEEIGESLKESGNILHLNRKQDLVMTYIGPDSEIVVSRERAELYEIGEKVFLDHMHPYSLHHTKPIIEDYHKNSTKDSTFTYIQYFKPIKSKNYTPLLTTCLNLGEGNHYLKLSLMLNKMDKAVGKMEYLMQSEEFARKHFEQFMTLTPREKQILTLTAEGKKANDISDLLFISRYTVNSHRRNINQKLGIKSYRDVICYAMAFDLISF